MSHGLTIPEANKSPYPIQEPPHAHHEPVEVAKKANKANKPNKTAKSAGRAKDTALSGTIVAGAALGLGALALVVTLFERRSKAPVPKARKNRKN